MGPEDLEASQLEATQANLMARQPPQDVFEEQGCINSPHTKELSNKAN